MNNVVQEWKQSIHELESRQGRRNMKERRCVNRFLSGGGKTEEYRMLMSALTAGGWVPNWLSRMNIFKTSEAIGLMKEVQTKMKTFCNALESGQTFPHRKFQKALETSTKLCESAEMKAIRENPEEMGKMIQELEVRENESRSSYLTRAVKWAWRNKKKVTVAVFAAYMIWCRYFGEKGCGPAKAIVEKISKHMPTREAAFERSIRERGPATVKPPPQTPSWVKPPPPPQTPLKAAFERGIRERGPATLPSGEEAAFERGMEQRDKNWDEKMDEINKLTAENKKVAEQNAQKQREHDIWLKEREQQQQQREHDKWLNQSKREKNQMKKTSKEITDLTNEYRAQKAQYIKDQIANKKWLEQLGLPPLESGSSGVQVEYDDDAEHDDDVDDEENDVDNFFLGLLDTFLSKHRKHKYRKARKLLNDLYAYTGSSPCDNERIAEFVENKKL